MSEQNNSIEDSKHNDAGRSKGDLSENVLTKKGNEVSATVVPKQDDSLLPVNPTSENQGPSQTPTEDEIDDGGWLCL